MASLLTAGIGFPGGGVMSCPQVFLSHWEPLSLWAGGWGGGGRRPQGILHWKLMRGPLSPPLLWLAPCSPPAIPVVRHRVAARVRCRGCSWAPLSLWTKPQAALVPPTGAGSSQPVPARAKAKAQHHSCPFLACIAGSGKDENFSFLVNDVNNIL